MTELPRHPTCFFFKNLMNTVESEYCPCTQALTRNFKQPVGPSGALRPLVNGMDLRWTRLFPRVASRLTVNREGALPRRLGPAQRFPFVLMPARKGGRCSPVTGTLSTRRIVTGRIR